MDVIVKAYAATDAGQIHLRRVDGPGLPILLFHRTPASSASFAAMLRRFAGKRAAVAFDTPGFGESFRPAGRPSTTDYARWLLAAIDALDIGDFHLCAHHTGTHFATEIALLAPDRTRSLLLSGVLHAGPELRASIRRDIGDAEPVDFAGRYLAQAWTTIRDLFPDYDAALVHADTIGALTAIEGRNQTFDAILAQDYPEMLARVTCPVAIVQASDDPLDAMLYRIRGRHPDLPITRLGRAGLALPERHPGDYAAAALAHAAAHDLPPRGIPMTDRRFTLVRATAGYDLAETRAAIRVPSAGEVLIRIRAVSLNRRDISIRDLSYPVGDADHFTALSDGAGEIVAVGDGVTRFAIGDRVASTFFQNWPDGRVSLPAIFSALGAGGPGVFADHVILSENGVVAIPADWSFEEGACLACAGVTAWSGLVTFGELHRDDWVLVIGTGGVAIFALQIAIALGAKVVVLSSSDAKLDHARALGAAVTINYTAQPEWDVAVKQATGGGVQHVIELGGVGTLARSLASAAVGGHIALIGALDGFGGDIPGVALIMAALRVSAVVVGSHADHVALQDLFVAHRLRPVIDHVFDADDAEDAYKRAATGAFGKVVIRMN